MIIQSKVIFITDADSDSGKSIIDLFANNGFSFILNSKSNGESIHQHINECNRLGCKTFIVNINLCSRSELEKMLETAALQVGTVDVLIHNNNEVVKTNIEACNEELFLQILDNNTKSAFFCTQVVGKQMTEKRFGKIIYVSSIHAEKPTGASFLYSTSKGAVKLLCREAALALGRYGVNVNSIELGPIEGDDKNFKSDISSLYESYEYKVPNTILGSHQDVANLVYFLSSEKAKYLNGADIRIDGGFVLHYMDHQMEKVKRQKQASNKEH